MEKRASSGNIIGLTNGPLTKARYVNKKIEIELVEFKKEIEEKFAKSKIKQFKFPLVASPRVTKLPNPTNRSSHRYDGSPHN